MAGTNAPMGGFTIGLSQRASPKLGRARPRNVTEPPLHALLVCYIVCHRAKNRLSQRMSQTQRQSISRL